MLALGLFLQRITWREDLQHLAQGIFPFRFIFVCDLGLELLVGLLAALDGGVVAGCLGAELRHLVKIGPRVGLGSIPEQGTAVAGIRATMRNKKIVQG